MSNQSATYWEPQPRENAYNSGDSSSSNSSTTGDNTDNDNAENSDEYVPGTFEGPEKTLEVIFKTAGKGLRALSRVQLDTLCKLAKCTILSTISSTHVDAYVLSESSLFVYDYRLIMKTCGTTTLLRCLGGE
jgi:S-adenosylmethionine decarboxylase